jgi:predicted small lipoprotein YifL
MKKLLTLGLSLLAVVAVLSLSACGQQDSGGSGETTTSGQPNQGDTATPNTGDTGGAGTTEGNSGATPAEPAAGGGQ